MSQSDDGFTADLVSVADCPLGNSVGANGWSNGHARLAAPLGSLVRVLQAGSPVWYPFLVNYPAQCLGVGSPSNHRHAQKEILSRC